MSTDRPSPSSYLTRVRNVPLFPMERVVNVFSASRGFLSEPVGSDHLLVATGQRIIAFSEERGSRQTLFLPLAELRGITVRPSPKNSLNMLQWLFTLVAGLSVYIAVSYWLTGKFEGPNIPVINIDLGPLLVLIAVLAAGWIISRNYFTPGAGSLHFQGKAWAFSFPYHQDRPAHELNQLVNQLFELSHALTSPTQPETTSAPPAGALPG